MPNRPDRNYVLIVAICIAALLPLTMLRAEPPEPAMQASACSTGLQAADRLQSDLGLDRSMMTRARSLADAAKQSGQAPPADQMQNLGEDTAEGLSDAADQMDTTAQEVNSQLERMQLTRQARAWNRGVSDLRSANSEFKRAVEGNKRPNAPGRTPFGDPSGVGPRVLYGAADNLQQSVDRLHTIQEDAQLQSLGGAGLQQGARDTPPPPNPVPSLAEQLNQLNARMNALHGRVKANTQALQSVREMAAKNFDAASRRVGEVQRGLDQATNSLGHLRNALASCAQPQPQRQQSSQGNAAAQGAAAAAEKGGGGAAKGILAVTGLGAAAAAGYLAYQAMSTCEVTDLSANTNACGNGSCSGCNALLAQVQTYCDCYEQKHPGELPDGTCGDFRDQVRQFKSDFCSNPRMVVPASPARR